ncbi:hypothetical protein [Fundicoccus culcitae]|uniref:Uncharacterized protein n=1 Tax=Fundicoccus culcitae TaxID=2969821 RepID=A0ABY5P5C8_9LACT|nr:hypothetical protein [Fundicoccus culcitae]UUX33613.1 hypothetical protein NRE15_12005 [Fundicoccus culcitae]
MKKKLRSTFQKYINFLKDELINIDDLALSLFINDLIKEDINKLSVDDFSIGMIFIILFDYELAHGETTFRYAANIELIFWASNGLDDYLDQDRPQVEYSPDSVLSLQNIIFS